MRKALILLTIMLLCALAHAQEDLSRPEGRWEVAHTDGKIFFMDLKADHTCTSTYGDGETGTWSWHPRTGLTMDWTDGWRDRIFANQEGRLEKWGWEPGADRDGPPSNQTRARKL